jgi:hypothetical protein
MICNAFSGTSLDCVPDPSLFLPGMELRMDGKVKGHGQGQGTAENSSCLDATKNGLDSPKVNFLV